MKKLLSLPPNVVGCFHEIEKEDEARWFCTSDPVGARLGSGGGTAWLLEACRRAEDPDMAVGEWLAKEKRILLHAAGQSRRLPGYAPSGKVLTPVPVFRWARGQRLSQNLLSLQLPLYEKIMEKAPEGLHTLVASGDVLIRHEGTLQEIPEADVVCYGLWVDPGLATRHGVFVSKRTSPEKLDYMLQKPSLTQLEQLTGTHFFLMDIGIWLLSDRAVEWLMARSRRKDGGMRAYDLYAEFGLSLGEHPQIEDKDINPLTVAILPLMGGEFYHFGTSRELISSTLAVQNRVNDQRMIMHRKLKPHPAMFVQNAEMHRGLTEDNSELWVENSCVEAGWQLHNRHIITGVPVNNWKVNLPAGCCVDMVPVGESGYVVRPYGFTDAFTGRTMDNSTLFMERPLRVWAEERGVTITDTDDIQRVRLFPLCETMEEGGVLLRWMVSEPELTEGKALWLQVEKLSADELMDRANLRRLVAQREAFRKNDWGKLAANYNRSVFYQLDLADAAQTFADDGIDLPKALPEDAPLMTRIHDQMFRSRVLRLTGRPYEEEQQRAFAELREGLIASVTEDKQIPRLDVYRDQIVWGRSPVRIDLAGGWTDTPPYCMYAGGNVVNVAIELNGQPPLQVYMKPSQEYKIILRSIDLGAREEITTWEELSCYNKVGSPFSIPKAALALAGFTPAFAAERFASLEEQLKAFGCGVELTLLSAVPAGSGLGTSSILAATVLGTISDFCGLGWDKNTIGYRTLILEQLLTTGGGWQDQYGGILQGLKLLQTEEGFRQMPIVRWLPEHLFTDPEYKACHLLYYTGITRTAKDILGEIVCGMFLNSGLHLQLLSEMKIHALEMYRAIQCGDFGTYGILVGKTWEQNKALDAGTNPPAVEEIIHLIKDYTLGYKLPGAGGGGYLYMVAKDPDAAAQIRKALIASSIRPNARFVDMDLSTKGLQVSRS